VRQLQAVADVPTSSTSLAFVDALRYLGIVRVAVAATYPAELAGLFTAFLAAADIEVVWLSGRGLNTAAEVGATMGRREVLDLAARNDHPEAEAILLPDTALHTAAWLDELEERTHKTVLTANQVSLWKGLQLAGSPQPRPGLGRLLRA
jgi:maleate cis-trans isomerase